MTEIEVYDIARTFLGKVLRVDVRHARLTANAAASSFHTAVVKVCFGSRRFEIRMSKRENRITLIEITTRRRFKFDPRNPLNGFTQVNEKCEITVRNDRLDKYTH